MKIIIGLGNPEPKYRHTRHNVGWRVVLKLASSLKTSEWKKSKRFCAFLSEGFFLDEKILLARPTTYMNESGQSVVRLKTFYKVPIQNIWLICDDVYLPFGRIRIRTTGSAGTHNGLRSIITLLRTERFPRFRLGIHPEKEIHDLRRFVLERFTPSEETGIQQSIEHCSEAVVTALQHGFPAAMNIFHKK